MARRSRVARRVARRRGLVLARTAAQNNKTVPRLRLSPATVAIGARASRGIGSTGCWIRHTGGAKRLTDAKAELVGHHRPVGDDAAERHAVGARGCLRARAG